MALNGDHETLTQRFEVAKPDYVRHADDQAKIAAKKQDDDNHGLKSGSAESIHKTTAAASKDAQNSRDAKAERRARQLEQDALFLALYNSGDLDNYVAENTFGAMDDAEIASVIAQIEEETGKSFDDYARDILGELPDRRDGESEADYHRRVLTAIGDEILNDDLSFKPGYENDPVAWIIKRQSVYHDAKSFVARTNAQVPAHQTATAEDKQAVTAKAERSYVESDVLGDGLTNSGLSGISTEIQDGSADSALEKAADNMAGFGAALAMASDSFGSDFKTAAVAPTGNTETAPDQTADIKPTLPT